jgi:hypothetical protein
MATNDVYLRPDAGDGANGVRLRPDGPDSGSPVNYTLVCAAGAYVYSGSAASLVVGRTLPLATGTYVYTGQAAILSLKRNMPLAAGAYNYVGNAATLTYVPGAAKVDYVLALSAGAYVYTGKDAQLTYVSGATNEEIPSFGANLRWDKYRRKPTKIKRSEYVHQQEYAEAVKAVNAMIRDAEKAIPISKVTVSEKDDDEEIMLLTITSLLH